MDATGDQLGRLVRIEIAKGGLEAALCIGQGLDPRLLDPMDLIARANEAGLPATPQRDNALRGAIRLYVDGGGRAQRVVIATGTPAVHGVDGGITLASPRPKSGHASDASQDRDASRRMRVQAQWRAPGTVVGRVVPPTHGVDGLDVQGRPIPARTGRAMAMRTDESLLVRSDGLIIAVRGGVFEKRGPVIGLNPTLTIDDSVDFSTGNLEFPGSVEITKGIRDCFHVRAGGDIVVRDLVDAATLEARGSIVLDKGIAAREIGRLRAGKDLTARYVTNVQASVGRDARIQTELAGSALTVGRDLLAPGCSVHRGELRVARACELKDLGSEAHSPTIAWLGDLGEHAVLLQRMVRTYTHVKQRHAAIAARLEQTRRAGGGGRGPMARSHAAADHAELMTQLQFEEGAASDALRKLVKAGTRLLAFLDSATSVDLIIHGNVFPGVQLRAAGLVAEVRQALRGPLRLTLDEHGQLIVTDLATKASTPLAKVARIAADTDSDGKVMGVSEAARALGLDVESIRALAA